MTVKIDPVTMTLPVVGPDQLWILILYLDQPRLAITGRRGVRLMGNLVVDRVACTHANEALLLSRQHPSLSCTHPRSHLEKLVRMLRPGPGRFAFLEAWQVGPELRW